MVTPDDPFLSRAADWATGLRWRDLSPVLRRSAGAQRLAAVGAVAWSLSLPEADRLLAAVEADGGEAETATLLGRGPVDPATAAAGHATLAAALGFEDGVIGSATGFAPVFVPLAYAEAEDATWRRAIVGQVAANEVAARVASAAAIGPLETETAAHVLALATAVGRGVVEGDDPGTLADAMALSLSEPPWPLTVASLGSPARPVMTTGPVRAGLDAVETARAGIGGPHDVLEAEDGFLDAFATTPLPEYLDGLGTRWHTSAVSVTAAPVSPFVAPAIEATLDARRRLDSGPVEVSHVTVDTSAFTLQADERTRPYIRGPDSSLGALTTTIGYNVAAALVDGEHTARQYGPDRRGSRLLWELESRVFPTHDRAYTKAALDSDLPPGGPLRRLGPAGLGSVGGSLGTTRALSVFPTLLKGFRPGPLPDDLSLASRRLGARVTVTLATGERVVAECETPTGFAGRPLSARRAAARRLCEGGLESLAREGVAVRRRVEELREPTGVVSLGPLERLRPNDAAVAH